MNLPYLLKSLKKNKQILKSRGIFLLRFRVKHQGPTKEIIFDTIKQQ